MQPSYTPFLTQAGAAIGRGLEKRGVAYQKEQQNKLAGRAYMGDPQAMQELMQVNPQLGIQVQQQAQKKADTEAQNKLTQQTGFKKDFAELSKNIATFPDYASSKQYAEEQMDILKARYPLLSQSADAAPDAEFDEETFNQIKQFESKAKKGDEVQSSKILPGGLVQQVFKSGAVKVVEPEEENVEKIKEAEKRGAELQGLRAGERGAGSSAIKQSVDAFKQMVGVRKTISLYDEGIRLLAEEGADTGPIEKMFPSFKSATVELDNVQDNLGLNVIQNTTFGSLSEQELKFALDSTMPQGLNAPQLVDWMNRKRETQMKLGKYLEEAAVFLGTPGNTIADFIRQQKTKQFVSGEQETPSQDKNDQALQWARNNPDDPRSAQILQKLGAK